MALRAGEDARFTRLDIPREPRKDLSITEQGRQCPQEDIIRVRYLDDHTDRPHT
jgi:hypothetical protein